ncbi:V-type ATP synthase subunit A [Peptostreptococcaceae bacterium AGR-M142]
MNDSRIVSVNGPVVKINNASSFKIRDMVMVGNKKLIGEIISIEKDEAIVQVYEETQGLKFNEIVKSTNKPLSLKLGPGLIGNIFDGIQRPLKRIEEVSGGGFIKEGIGLLSLNEARLWNVDITTSIGKYIKEGDIYAKVQESSLIEHKLMVPKGIEGEVFFINESKELNIDDVVLKVKDTKGNETPLYMHQYWPVRIPRPIKERLGVNKLLVTGQRVLDVFFPIGKGGTVALPGGFGTGKTMTQHQLAKWSDADIIIYIGCGERGNEMTQVLNDFPELIDPKSNKPLMERTILIANTSNMPVAAREASIYTGITLAEYYRDMGYHVAIMADSTSRWAEALREISGRLEEMPGEEGYPAYLSSRLAVFYERAGYVNTIGDREGSVTVIGAVSPPGGDFSEPVTSATKRFVNAFLALDRNLAYSRHYPAINFLQSYSSYINLLTDFYEENFDEDILAFRKKALSILHEEEKLMEIVKLVGEDVLPDKERLILEIAKIIRKGYLQQNALHSEDTYVPLKKQELMLRVIIELYEKSVELVKKGVALSQVKDEEIFLRVLRMKYEIKNNEDNKFLALIREIDEYYQNLKKEYNKILH